MKLEKILEPNEPIGFDVRIEMRKCDANHPERDPNHPPYQGNYTRYESTIDIDSDDGFVAKKLKEKGVKIEYPGFIFIASPEFFIDINRFHHGFMPNIKRIKVDGFHFPLKQVFQGKMKIIDSYFEDDGGRVEYLICSLELLE